MEGVDGEVPEGAPERQAQRKVAPALENFQAGREALRKRLQLCSALHQGMRLATMAGCPMPRTFDSTKFQLHFLAFDTPAGASYSQFFRYRARVRPGSASRRAANSVSVSLAFVPRNERGGARKANDAN